MPIFTPDPSKVQVALEIFDKGEYVFQVGEPKAFYRQKKDAAGNPTTDVSYGILYPVVCMAPDNAKGKKQLYNVYLNGDGFAFGKAFVMACLGFNPRDRKSEQAFDSQYSHADWSVNTETGAVGDIWREIRSKLFIASVDIGQNPNTGEPTQQFKSVRPVPATAGATA